MKHHRTTSCRLALLCIAAACSNVAAAPHLVGFVVYRADASGNALNSPAYFYTTNTRISAYRPVVTPPVGPTQSQAISIPLTDGVSTISFAPSISVNPGAYAGVQLYFNDTGITFNPLGAGVPADLAAFVPTGTSSLTAVTAGRQLIDYGNSYGPLIAYGGATQFTVGDRIVSITALSVNSQPAGSVTLMVKPIPGPGPIPLLAAAGLAALRRARRR